MTSTSEGEPRTVEELQERRSKIETRLEELGANDTATSTGKSTTAACSKRGSSRRNSKTQEKDENAEESSGSSKTAIPYSPKTTDTHWDFVMKEMMWLGADFQGERKRQNSLAKKLASSVKQHHKTKETRRLRELHQAEMKRRKLAAKIGREVRGWWNKIEKVISYKQKLLADREREAAMNKQLVSLVQQTEKYTESLAHNGISEDDDDDNDTSDETETGDSGKEETTDDVATSDSDAARTTSGSEDGGRRRRRRRLTIEEALAAEQSLVRNSKKRVIDYSRLELPSNELYGESTASDRSGSDGSYSIGEDEDGSENNSDDDSTFQQAIHEELRERNQDETGIFLPDPEELCKLREEVSMDVDDVIKRFRKEGENIDGPMEVESARPDTATRRATTESKHVHFSETVEEDVLSPVKSEPNIKGASASIGDPVGKYDADDDADASDVEDYDDEAGQRSDEEFLAEEPEADDETTIEQEESLPRETTAKEELALLQKEGDMSVEELRKIYANVGSASKETGATPAESGEEEERQSNALTGDTDQSDNEAFQPPITAEVDDETTIDAEEKLGRDMTYEEEMSTLKRESEIPIEKLRAMYAKAAEIGEDTEGANGEMQSEDLNQPAEGWATSLLEGGIQEEGAGSEDEGAQEFEFIEGEAVDDETTLEAEEKLGRDMSYDHEIALLKQESEMSVEELKTMYGNITAQDDAQEGDNKPAFLDDFSIGDAVDEASSTKTSLTSNLLNQASEDEDEDDYYAPDETEGLDDETTVEAEERLGRDMSHEAEIALLKRESEISVEELRNMYGGGQKEDNSEDVDEEMQEQNDSEDRPTVSVKRMRDQEEEGDENGYDNKKVKLEGAENVSDDGLAALNALNALEASAQKAQRTLASRPFLLAGWVNLRRYQQVGLNWLVSLQSRRLNGILADEMGLGKTLQTIALLAYLASYKGIWGPHLIVVPTSVIINWETELKRFCPALKVLCYYGSAKRRKELRQGWTKTNWNHVVITSYQLAVQDAFAFKRKKWYYLVLDEAQNIKNFQSQRWQTLISFNTQRRLLLTGTPLQNNLMELWSLLHFLMPYIFRSRKEFSYWFSNPMNNIIEGSANRNDDVIKRLHGIIRPFVLRRLKKDVETQMPGKFEHIIKCQLSRRQMALYEEFLSRSSTRMALKKGGNFMGMMNVLMQLRKVCNHPDLFEPRSVVTPFVLPSLSCKVPSFVCKAIGSVSVLEKPCPNLLEPIWCGSGGLPSIDGSLRHDAVESEQLRRLQATITLPPSSVPKGEDDDCPDELRGLLRQVHSLRREQADSNVSFQNKVNQTRCHAAPFPYPANLLKSLEVEYSVLQRTTPVEVKDQTILLTPDHLLDMRKNEQQRADDMEEVISKFVFCVPPAGARTPVLDAGNIASERAYATKNLDEMLLEPVEELVKPFRKTQARLSSFFPDKKLIQFDAGKLQTLAVLLRDLKQGGHRALIFTQMSKMLDILEAFLNLHGHTYLRLDGATGVDRRQRYMDRFNNDSKIFCFILSTRSGGMGINLTGADSVIFFDSDWNPAMDAQAQDRAHRIGQTRDVHIYRLVTEHTIEENILLKAQQKRNLDKMVMDQGKFDASHQLKGPAPVEEASAGDEMKDVYTKGGLRAILGVDDESPEESEAAQARDDVKDASGMSNEQMEMAMASLEDEDDVQALRGAQKEAAEELKEFDETAEIQKESDAEDESDDDDGGSTRPKKKQKKVTEEQPVEESETDEKKEESELEKEFAAWQSAVGFDAAAIESSLSPMERYGLSFRENIDPFYSIFYTNEMKRKSEANETQNEIDIDEIEREKAMEERRAIEDGDLLATRPRPEDLIRQRNLYRREKVRLRSDKKRRKLTGENWVQRVDGLTKNPFWYNEDTGEAIWDTPTILIEMRAEELASKRGWGWLQIKILVQIMGFLVPYPERHSCSLVCKQWKTAASDFRFILHVYPVEMGALSRDPTRREYNHYGNIKEALSIALPGDTIELSDGHYWITDAGLLFDKPLRLIGDENNAANVVIEMSGSAKWSGQGGVIEGVTFRRPTMPSTDLPSFPMLKIEGDGHVDIVHSVLDNEGSTGETVFASGSGRKGSWGNVTIRNGGSHGVVLSGEGVSLQLHQCTVRGNKNSGVHCSDKGTFFFTDGVVQNNGGFGVELASEGAMNIHNSRFTENRRGVLQREAGCNMSSSGNVAFVKKPPGPGRGHPGFRLLSKGQEDIASVKLQGSEPPGPKPTAPLSSEAT